MNNALSKGIFGAILLGFAGHVPFLNLVFALPGLYWLLWIGFWIWLAGQMVSSSRESLQSSSNPAVTGMGYGALLGLLTGIVGPMSGMAASFLKVTLFTTMGSGQTAVVGAGLSALSGLSSMIALFLYPAFGVFWCGLFGLVWGGSVKRQP